jgi:hypothetical protein
VISDQVYISQHLAGSRDHSAFSLALCSKQFQGDEPRLEPSSFYRGSLLMRETFAALNHSQSFVVTDYLIEDGEAKGLTAIWIGAVSKCALILITIGLMILLVGYRRRLLSSTMDIPESDLEIDIDTVASSQESDHFVSDHNAVSVELTLPGQFQPKGGEESPFADFSGQRIVATMESSA